MSKMVVAAKGNVPASPTSTNIKTFAATARALKKCMFDLELAEQLAPRLPEIAHQITAMRRPITARELAIELGKMVCAFPNGKADSDFSAAMLDNLEAMHASIGAVWLARYTLVSNRKFLPAIAEVRQEIKKAEAFLDHAESNVERLPERISYLKASYKRNEEERCRQKEDKARWREERERRKREEEEDRARSDWF